MYLSITNTSNVTFRDIALVFTHYSAMYPSSLQFKEIRYMYVDTHMSQT